MKDIKGHKSWNRDELVDMLSRTGTYTCPTLPHYRYDRVKSVCNELLKRKLVRKSGKNDVSINLVVTDRFKEWKSEKDQGITTLGVIKWVKEKYPIKSKASA